MGESITFTGNADRETIYREIAPQIESLIAVETDLIANLANIAAVLKQALDFFWVGFYLKRSDQLILGPFQGPLACTRIGFGKGVCGLAYERRETIIVSNVDEFPGHITCSSAVRSEIVVPIFGRDGEVFGVIDVDSDELGDFSKVDAKGLEQIARSIGQTIPGNEL
jgi:GAF domain-containing protein